VLVFTKISFPERRTVPPVAGAGHGQHRGIFPYPWLWHQIHHHSCPPTGSAPQHNRAPTPRGVGARV